MNMRRRLAALVLATGVALSGGLATGAPVTAAPAQQDVKPAAVGVFQQIRNVWSGKCVIPKGNSSNHNALIVQRTCENRVHHRWILQPLNNGYYWIINQGSGLCLDLVVNSEAEVIPGVKVQQFGCETFYTSEQWRPVNFGSGYISFQTLIHGLCLDVLFRSTANDAQLQVVECKPFEPAQWFYYA